MLQRYFEAYARLVWQPRLCLTTLLAVNVSLHVPFLSQAVSTASTDLQSALAGVTLSAEEQASLKSKLQAAADKKLGDLLQVCKLCYDSNACRNQ
jgi:hypothetical protein